MLGNPVLFMQLWCIPAILHHFIFNWLATIGPILYFFAGIIFCLLAQGYIALLFLHVEMDDSDATKRYYSTDASIKDNMMRKRIIRGFSQDFVYKPRRKHRSAPKVKFDV